MEVRPFPKAMPRVENQPKGRKRGRCRILTDTPEKVELEAEREKQVLSVKSLRKRGENLEMNRPKKKKMENKIESDSSEDEDVWEDSGDSLDDIDPFSATEESEVEEDNFFEECNPKIKDFVFVEFGGKKGKTYFVGEVTEVDPSASELLVNFLRKKKSHFHFPATRDEGLVSRDSVKKILPL